MSIQGRVSSAANAMKNMIRKNRRLAYALCATVLLLLAGAAWAQIIHQKVLDLASTDNAGFSYMEWEVEEGHEMSLQDGADAIAEHFQLGTPLPPGLHLTMIGPRITVAQTGAVLQVGDRKLIHGIVTIREDPQPDIETAELWIDGQLVFIATRSNGAVVDCADGTVVATMTAFADPCALSSVELIVHDSAALASRYTVDFRL